MKLLFKAGSALVSSWSPTGMSKCRLETVRSSRDPAHSGNRMCFAVTFSRSRNYTTKTQIRWCDFTQQQPLCGACNHCLYFPMSVCGSPPSLFFFLFFFLPLAAAAVTVCLKQTFFPEHRQLSPYSGWCTALCYVCPSGFFFYHQWQCIGPGDWRRTKDEVAFFHLHVMPRYPSPLSSWWVLTNAACLGSLSGTIWNSHFNMTSGAFEASAAGVKAL